MKNTIPFIFIAITSIACGGGDVPYSSNNMETVDINTLSIPVTSWWKPSSSQPLQLHWQLSTAFSYPRDVVSLATVYDVDNETKASAVASLHALGAKVICYVSVGSYEDFRDDAYKFPASVIGNSNGWSGENWLDIRNTSVLIPLMRDRFINCANKGFDAIEPDNLDVWDNNSGFPITRTEGLAYVLAIADLAHSLNLSVGLKNLPDEASGLVNYFDWSLNEQCFQYSECSGLSSFTNAGKAVWNVEYKAGYPNCAVAASMHMNAQRRDINLLGPTAKRYRYVPCPPYQ